MKKIALKGGSLSSTTLIISGRKKFVRKEISLKLNREYGYQRWYSQLKRIQRYNKLFPRLFPKLLDFGISKKDKAYFDIQYIENSLSGYEFLFRERNKKKIDKFFKNLIKSMNVMHCQKLDGSQNSIHLYLKEEVDKKINDCMINRSIKNELSLDFFIINKKKVPNILRKIDKYKKIFISNFTSQNECFTHGNITLENMVYNSKKK